MLVVLTPAAALPGCGDSQCGTGEDWISCFIDCPRPVNSWAVVGTLDAQTMVTFKEGIGATIHSRMTEVPVDKVEITPGKTTNKVFRIIGEKNSGVINPYSYFRIRCKIPLKTAWVHFSVEKSWLREKNMSADDVGVFYMSEGWNKIDVILKGQDSERAYYKFKVTKFRLFAIGSKKGLDNPDTLPVKEIELRQIPKADRAPEKNNYSWLSAGFSVMVIVTIIALKNS